MYNITFNGKSSESYGLVLSDYPEISYPQNRMETVKIPGKDGGIITGDMAYDDVLITCNFAVLANSGEEWNRKIRASKRWIREKVDERLILSDDTDYYFKVKKATVDNVTRELKRYSSLEVTFVCHPYKYVIGSSERIEPAKVMYNAYDESHPIYQIEGDGTCVLSVNGREMQANVNGSLVIDTERRIAFAREGKERNTAVTGDYEELFLCHGENVITISDGFLLKLAPMWGELV